MAGAILGKFSGKACDSNVINNNDMFLSRKLFENVISSQEYKDGIARGHYIGYLGHPEDPGCQEFKDGCIVMTDMNIEENGDIHADFNLIDTPVGRVVKAFIDAGVKFGISIRGAGDVSGNGDVDPDTFIFRGFDLVAFPAYNDCVPEFQEIAASKDLEKQKKYKRVCAAVESNLSNITSCSALEIIKDQLVEGSDPYVQVETRLQELNQSPETSDVENHKSCVCEEQVNALVQMYSEALKTISDLECTNARLEQQVQDITTACVNANSKIKRLQRIHERQITELDKAVTAAEKVAVTARSENVQANRKIEEISIQLKKSEKLNLNYSQKIQSSKSLLSEKEREITRIQSELRETVAASKELKSDASNFDARFKDLEDKVQAAEEMIFAYQQAYANMFANALGKKVSNLSVTASTTPESLRKAIATSTSTANIPAKPEFTSCEYFDGQDDEDGIISV